MERVSDLTPKVNLSTYRELINLFLPFVLIRCTRYTNSKRLAETIAVYTFVCAYYLTRIPRYKDHLPEAIGCMADVVGDDLGDGPNTLNGRPLFEREDVLCAAKTLAGLGMEECLATVLYYVEKLQLERVSQILGKSVDEMLNIVDKARSQFLKNLSGLWLGKTISSEGQIPCSMASVNYSFDLDQFNRITATVMDYLIQQT